MLNKIFSNGHAVTPSDSANLNASSSALYVGVTGNISLVTDAGQTITLVGVPAGAILPIRTKRVNATGTTATNIIALG